MTTDFDPTPLTTGTRLRERITYDRGAVHAVLDEAVVCHVGFVVDGRPVVLPQLHARVGDRLYLHGSTGARSMRTARTDGIDLCVTVTLIDALVLARSAFHHSVNYRSVVVHGTAVQVTDLVEKERALAALVDGVVPGRSAGVRGANRKELAATTVLALDLEQVSLKVRTGPPGDDDEDLDLPYWTGLLPLTTTHGTPVPAPTLAAGIEEPEHIRAWYQLGSPGPLR